MKLNLTIAQFTSAIQANQVIGTYTDLLHRIAYDTRKLSDTQNTVFFALAGKFRDGSTYIKDAYHKGVRVFVVNSIVGIEKFSDVCFLVVDSPLKALQKLFH